MKIKVKDLVQFNELIIKKGFTKNGLGKRAKVSGPMINQITNGVRNPSPPVAKRIVDTLEVEFDDIFYIEKSEAVASK